MLLCAAATLSSAQLYAQAGPTSAASAEPASQRAPLRRDSTDNTKPAPKSAEATPASQGKQPLRKSSDERNEQGTRSRWPAAARRSEHVLNALGPTAWPGLSHNHYTLNFELVVATAEPIDINSGTPLDDRAFSYAARWLMEFPLVERAWYAGIVHDIAAASVPSGSEGSGGSTWVLGNPEMWLRGLWTSELGLSAGGGASIVVPIPRTFSPLEAEVVRAIRVVRGDSYAHFRDLVITFRPYLDVRHVVGPLVLQMRQGLDVGVLARDPQSGEDRYDLTAITVLYAGVTVLDRLTFGLEGQEVYQITAPVDSSTCLAPCDERRAQLSLSPSVRLKTPRLSPSLSVIFPLSTPLREEVSSFIAGRLNIDVGF